MGKVPFTKGLHKIGEGCYAYLQPDGSWGLNNAGLIVSGNEAFLIDTLYDYNHTRQMLSAINDELGDSAKIKYLVNTHSNGDHYFGNGLVEGAQIISSEICTEEMKIIPPAKMAGLMKAWQQLGPGGEYLHKYFKKFDFENIPLVLPDTTFTGEMELSVGSRTVNILEVRDAHTGSDLMVYLADEKVLFASDLLFIGGTPIVWSTPLSNWIKALDMILEMDVRQIVPGHGPVTDKEGVGKVKEYFEYVYDETKKRFEKKMSILDAALDINLKEFGKWGETERITTIVHTIYRELDPALEPIDAVGLFGLMAAYKQTKKK